MLKIVAPPDSSKAHLVHCELEHVSLDNFSNEFQKFLSSTCNSCNPTILTDWVKISNPEMTLADFTYNSPLSLPCWRKTMQDNDEDNTCFRWRDTMEPMNANPSQYAMPDVHSHYDPIDIISPIILPKMDPAKKEENFSLLPRFQWGDFEAISYYWESEIRDKHIYLNGAPFAVPTNLEALLQRLRRLRTTNLGMKFWIDALCIN